ncbi:DUF7285 family protein [Haloarchaeobius sp. DFWS5]|uniref:DUF7285 family protein n=1 Tax=Haloarchaeobius sp. DFWS5 TaxID=3446114 RepID=UPI003EBB0C48
MSRSSSCRAQTEPTAALAAVLAVCLGLTLYAGTLTSTLQSFSPGDDDTQVAESTLGRAYATVAQDGVVDPDRLSQAATVGPAGYHVAVRLTADSEHWRAGPASPEAVATAVRPVSVRLAPGVVVSGTLRVEVWT